MSLTLTKLPLISYSLSRLNHDLGEIGFQLAMKKVVTNLGVKLLIQGLNKKTSQILLEKPLVIVANEPCGAEIIMLAAALPPRENTSIIMNADFLNLSSNFDKYIIPVYIRHHKAENKLHRFSLKLLNLMHRFPTLSPEEEHQRNIRSIASASQRVGQGGAVIIFPEAKSVDGKWRSGVGYLLKNIQSKDRVYLVKCYISGTSPLDYLRLIPQVSKILPAVKITFSQPQEVGPLLDIYQDPKKLTEELERQYYNWLKSIS